jgi:hypothetical protein
MDDIVRAVSSQASCRKKRRVFPLLPKNTQNKLARIGSHFPAHRARKEAVKASIDMRGQEFEAAEASGR